MMNAACESLLATVEAAAAEARELLERVKALPEAERDDTTYFMMHGHAWEVVRSLHNAAVWAREMCEDAKEMRARE